MQSRMPKFFRFASYQNLEGRVDVASLRTSEGEHPGASPKQTTRALLRLADTDIDSVTDAEFESRTAKLEAVSSDLSREMSEHWSTNPELRIKVEIEPETVSMPNGQSSVVRYLNFRVEDRKHDFTNNFSLRSSGCQWFFSFLAAFSEFEDLDDVVILLDEPALTLHAKAQRDFLRFINKRLATVGQVVYTTHSPFMVEQIERVRVVEDRGDDIGSVTSSDALEVGEDSAFPLQAALGYDLSQNLFIGERNLLVEGPSDLAYLDVIGRHLRDLGREGLDERWRILPAGGASNVSAFVSLLGQKVSVTVLLDSGTEGGPTTRRSARITRSATCRTTPIGYSVWRRWTGSSITGDRRRSCSATHPRSRSSPRRPWRTLRLWPSASTRRRPEPSVRGTGRRLPPRDSARAERAGSLLPGDARGAIGVCRSCGRR